MFHPYARIAGWFDEVLDGHRGPGNCIWSQEFYETDRARGVVRGYTLEFCRGHRACRRRSCRRTGMVAICEDLSEEHNNVTLVPC